MADIASSPVGGDSADTSTVPNTILIVDDDPSIRGMVRSVLRREGFEVEAAASGSEAIAHLDARPFDAVVLDILLGDGSGLDILQTLAIQRPNVKCVVVTSAGSPATLEELDAANVEAALRKPFDIQDLVNAIANCVGTPRSATQDTEAEL